RAYLALRSSFFRSQRGRIALQYGGIIDRLARIDISETDVMLGITDDVLLNGKRLSMKHSTQAYWTDQLAESEVDLICGGSNKVSNSAEQISFRSWWPKPAAWAQASVNVGWWTAQCEEWFKRWVTQITEANGKILRPKEWKSLLTRDRVANGCVAGHEKIAGSIVESLFP
ncbi:hypothetical protein FB45DRAFT_761535, partial [Roridomyces roridus]